MPKIDPDADLPLLGDTSSGPASAPGIAYGSTTDLRGFKVSPNGTAIGVGTTVLAERAKAGAGGDERAGILGLYVEEGRVVHAILDEEGRERPEWASLLLGRPLRSQRVKAEEWISLPGWPDRIRALFGGIRRPGTPLAVAAFRIVTP